MAIKKPERMHFLLVALLALYAGFASAADWRTASHASVGLAPDPASTSEAVIQVYGARTWGWKGIFGVHTWVAVKPSKARKWTVYEVIGWRLRWADSVVVVSDRAPDARWYGSAPELYAEKRGEGVDELIERIDKAAQDYPYAGEYGLWPGPNSNTFTAWLTRAVPELEVDLPATAIGKDYLRDKVIDSPPSGNGVQVSLAGLLGVTASSVEGFEVNVLGLTFGFGQSGLKLPFVGHIGPSRAHAAASVGIDKP
jgi:hypothetical protein